MNCRFLILIAGWAVLAGGAQAQTPGTAPLQQPVAGALLSDGYEVKAVINNTYLILQKGDKAFWCGSSDPSLTWANWPLLTREAICVPLNR